MPEIGTYEPINCLKPVADQVWIVDGPLIDFQYLGLRIPFPTRMTILRLADGSLWIHSPTGLAPTVQRQVDALGPVRHLIAPNTIHYAWIPDWKSAYPAAATHAAPGVCARARRMGIAIDIDRELGDAPDPDWAGQIDQVLVHGAVLSEVVFFHRRSRTLILTDLIENFEPHRLRSRWWRLLVRLSGAMDPDGKAPIDMRLTFLGHRKALRAAVRRMIAWHPDRVILAHGRWYDRDGAAELARAFRWLGPLGPLQSGSHSGEST